MKKIIYTLLLLATSPLFAQENNPHIVSGDLLEQGDALYDSGQYKKAIALLSRIDGNDTNYVRSLYGLSLAYAADSQFDAAIQSCKLALKAGTDPEKIPDVYNQYGNAMDAAGFSGNALLIYDSAMRKYPGVSIYYMNKGTTLIRLKRYAEAEKVLQKGILMDPYSYSSHFKLAVCALNQGKLIPAFYSLLGYLLLSPDGRYGGNAINLLSAIAKNEDDVRELIEKRTDGPDDSYRLLEQILQSKIALDKNYKPITRLDDPISRQIQVIFEKMDYQESDSDFYMQYYVPYFKAVFTGGQFETFINHIFSGVKLPAIQEYNRKNKKELSNFADNAGEYFNLIRLTRELSYKKRNMDNACWFYTKGRLTGYGKYLTKADKLVGPWEFYYSAGNIQSRGSYNDDGKKDGPWTYYYFDGTIKGKEIYHNGSQENEETYYFNTGDISTHSWYKDNMAEGESVAYFLTGAPHTITHYHAGKMDGIKLTFSNTGDTSMLETYAAGVLDGPARSWYSNGNIETIATYKNGQIDGPYKKYYNTGVLKLEGAYTAGKQTGPWKDYHPNGKLKSELNYVNDKADGEYKEFNDKGQVSNTGTYRNGKANGESRYYDDDGKVYAIYNYSNDLTQKVQYLDKNGKTMSQSERKNRSIDITQYLPDGSKRLQAAYNEKDNINGTETFYYPSGNVLETDEYLNGEEEGPGISYYADGQKKVENMYAKGKLNGYHKAYYPHGQLQEEGWYADGDQQGYWLYYNELGKLTDSVYFRDGNQYGYKTSFWPNGKKSDMIKYRSGWQQEWLQYDTLGKEINHLSFPGGSGRIALVLPNGKPSMKVDFKHGQMDGRRTLYFFDGTIEEESTYHSGKEEGAVKTRNYAGVTTLEGQYRSGERTGTWKYYTNKGLLSHTTDYSFGRMHGKDTWYYDNGKPEIETSYTEDERTLYKSFDPDGTLRFQITYKHGNPVAYSYLDKTGRLLPDMPIERQSGKIKTLFPNGQVSGTFEYKDGMLDGEYKLYYANGQLYREKHNHYNNLEGNYDEYYPNGKMKSHAIYLHNNLQGVYKEYNDKGILTLETSYYLDSPNGVSKHYDDNGKLRDTYFYYYGKLLSVKHESAH